MMELVVYFERTYRVYLKNKKSPGCCMGMCLVWLGDILKKRAINTDKGFLKSWANAWFLSPRVTNTAVISTGRQDLIRLFDRAYRRQEHYDERCDNFFENHIYSRLSDMEVTVNLKNCRQREQERQTGRAGLIYSYKRINSLCSIDGLAYNERMQGVILCFTSPDFSPGGAHAVAAVSTSRTETYLLDPNYGILKINNMMLSAEILEYLRDTYADPKALGLILISQK